MRFTEFLSEQPRRDQRGRYAKRIPGLEVPPERPAQTVNFQKTPGVRPIQPQNKPKPRVKPVPAPVQPTPAPVQPKTEKPQMTAQGNLGLTDNQPEHQDPNERQSDAFKKRGQETPDSIWEDLLNRSKENQELGRELLSLLGAMYQAKRRNPAVQLTEPKLITTMKNKDIKDQMQRLFNITRKEDGPHLAARSKQLQQLRKVGSAGGIGAQGITKNDNTMLQQVYQFIKKSTPEALAQAKQAIDKELKARKPEPELPPGKGEKKSVVGVP